MSGLEDSTTTYKSEFCRIPLALSQATPLQSRHVKLRSTFNNRVRHMMLNLLQRNINNAPGGAGAPPDPAAIMFAVAFYAVAIIVGITISIFFYLTLSRCLKQIKPRNRTMEPGQVWLNFIPLFGLVWFILTILKISESLKNEYEDRGMRGDGDYGKLMGILFYASNFVCPCVSLILLILYWVKIAGYTKELKADSGSGGRN